MRATSPRPARSTSTISTGSTEHRARSTAGSFGYRPRARGRRRRRSAPARCSRAVEVVQLQRPVGRARRCAQVQRRAALQPGHRRRRLHAHRRWPMPTPGTRPTRSAQRAIDRRASSAASARSIRPTAATRSAISLSGDWARPSDIRRRPRSAPMSSAHARRSTTTSPTSSTIPSTATSSASSTGARVYGPQRQPRLRHARSGGFETRDHASACRRATTTSHVGLFNTVQRVPLSTVRDDQRAGSQRRLCAPNTTAAGPTGCAPSSACAATVSAADVRATRRRTPATPTASIASPKAGLIFGPWHKTEFYRQCRLRLSLQRRARRHHHGRSQRQGDAAADACRCWCAPRAPRSACAPGRSKGSTSSLALFVLDFDSELLFVGDAGTTEPSRPSRRIGVEWTNHYKPMPWLRLRSRLRLYPRPLHRLRSGRQPHPGCARHGRLRPASRSATTTGWFGALRLRYFGPRPLIEDDSVRSPRHRAVQCAPRLQLRQRAAAAARRASTCSTRRPTRSTTTTSRGCPASRPAASTTGTSIRPSRWRCDSPSSASL